ncbi:hypothetical protein MRS76_24795, partial [Rhizobiaceae bacterium n13]|uniref:hypothetical protein n=1 Tax=Ferirhizobium litorale TaxID=2927786 RepID=UPI0024B30DA8
LDADYPAKGVKFARRNTGHRAFGRIDWLITANRACLKHGVQIRTSEQPPSSKFYHDFAANLAAERECMATHLSALRHMKVDALQQYIHARMAGMRTSEWLDSLPIYIAATTCELVGGIERYTTGYMNSELDQIELSACADLGFSLLQGSETNFRDFIRRRAERYFSTRRYAGGRSMFGRLYEKLAHHRADPNFEPVRRVMRDEVLNNVPLGPGDDFFGPVAERRLHSLRTAHLTFGVHPKRLLKSLVNAGLISSDASNTNGRTVLPADVMENFVREEVNYLTAPDAIALLGASRRSLDSLSERGLISVQGRKGENIRTEPRYDSKQIETFLTRIKSRVTCTPAANLVPLLKAVRVTNCTYNDLIEMILDDELSSVAWDDEYVGLPAIRIDPDEVLAKTSKPDPFVNLRTVETEIPSSFNVVRALVTEGYLPSIKRAHPVAGMPQTAVSVEALATFKQTYVSLANVAKARATRTRKCRSYLETCGIVPSFVAAEMPFYLRSSLPEV